MVDLGRRRVSEVPVDTPDGRRVLLGKASFMLPGAPGRGRQELFDNNLRRRGVLERAGLGPGLRAFTHRLAEVGLVRHPAVPTGVRPPAGDRPGGSAAAVTEDELDRLCGRHMTFRDLIEAGETWRRVRVPNLPRQAETVAALRRLAEEILDPVAARFGAPEVTYGFASPALTKHVPGRIDPARDQHAGHELRRDGKPICPRLGQAADFQVPHVCSGQIAAWIAEHLPFDRLYFYGSERPLHVSVGPEEARAVVSMLPGPSGRRVPRIRKVRWLAEQFGRG